MTKAIERIVLIPPASPGSKGDEAMIRGALSVFAPYKILIATPKGTASWIETLRLRVGEAGHIAEIMSFDFFPSMLNASDAIFFIGADVIDGTCGIAPSLERLDLAHEGLLRNLPVYVTCSFRSNVDPKIIQSIVLLPGIRYLLRDHDSLDRFVWQTGLNASAFPDLSFFAADPEPEAYPECHKEIGQINRTKSMVIGLNFGEHSFRSFHDRHDNITRQNFVAQILETLHKAFPDAGFVIFSNDNRRFENHISDDDFSDIAYEWILAELGESAAVKMPSSSHYSDNISMLKRVDFLVTGRMHLAYASFRAGTPALVLMGTGRGYTSIEKMRGGIKAQLGADFGVVNSIDQLTSTAVNLLARRTELRDLMDAFSKRIRTECRSASTMMRAELDLRTETIPSPHGMMLLSVRSALRAQDAQIGKQDLHITSSRDRIKELLKSLEQKERKSKIMRRKIDSFVKISKSSHDRIKELTERLEQDKQISDALARKINSIVEINDSTHDRISELTESLEQEKQLSDFMRKKIESVVAISNSHYEESKFYQSQIEQLQKIAEREKERADAAQTMLTAEKAARAEYQTLCTGHELRSSSERLIRSELIRDGFTLAEDLGGLAVCERWAGLVSQSLASEGLLISGIRIGDWGDRSTIEGTPVNQQPDGSSALWVEGTGLGQVSGLKVLFGGHPARPAHRERDDLITTGIPAGVIQNAGHYPVSLIDAVGRYTHVGIFSVKPVGRWHSLKSVVSRLAGRQSFDPGESQQNSQTANRSKASSETATRILVADYRLPMPDVSAGEKATVGLLTDLAAIGFEVVFVAADMKDDEKYRAALEKLGITVITRASGYTSAADYVKTHGSTFGAFYLIRVDVAEKLLAVARASSPQARIIFHAPDLYFLRERRAAEYSGHPRESALAEETRARETAVMQAADHVVLVSSAERPYVEEFVAPERISIFPALYSAISADPSGFGSRRNIFFLGGFKHTPNITAVQWFVENVWPTVHAALPDAEFHILGAEAPDAIVSLGRRPGVRFVGYVEDLTPVLDSYRLSVAPLLFGAGIKGKLAASLGAGVPAVTTPVGAEGMGIVDGIHALVRLDPNSFADAVISLYGDEQKWTLLAGNGRQLVERNFGELANRASFLRTLEASGALPPKTYVSYCQASNPLPLLVRREPEHIDVSIIIPVHNQWKLTRACLNSVALAIAGCTISCEVILADDKSIDETSSAAEIYPGLRIVRQPTNLGFLRNCKKAAEQARGEFLLFLNNDTIVMPNWLLSLFSTIKREPQAAIVGSQLLYPTEQVQEAGSVIYSDASAHPIGRGSNRNEPFLKLDREVDYISGASIAVRRSFWLSVGGFDEIFVPAYCEDSDLAMMARTHGLMVVYSGGSVVVHLEHGTYGEYVDKPSARIQSNNLKLQTKWKDVLAREHLNRDADPMIAAAFAERRAPTSTAGRRKSGKMKILYFSPFPSHPSNHGNQATIQSFGKTFQRLGHHVHFVLLESSLYSDRDRIAMQETWNTLDVLSHSCKLGSDGSDIPFDGWYGAGLGEAVYRLCRSYDIDIIICSYVFQSKLLDYVPQHILKVIDTHDKMGGRYDMLRANGQLVEFFSCTAEEEGAYLRRADVVLARRAEEARYFDQVSGRHSAIVIPHIEPQRDNRRSFTELRTVGIVASPNRINLALLSEFLMEIGSACGDDWPFDVVVAGQVKDMVKDLPRNQQQLFQKSKVRMLGFVPDIGEFYSTVDLIVSPVTMGTGINVKTVQAMAYGMPLLTTKVGIKGIETDEPLHNHETVRDLVQSLLALSDSPSELERLAEISVVRYRALLVAADSSFQEIFNHPKLIGELPR